MGTGRLPGLERCRLKYGGHAVSAAWPLFVEECPKACQESTEGALRFWHQDFDAGYIPSVPYRDRETGIKL